MLHWNGVRGRNEDTWEECRCLAVIKQVEWDSVVTRPHMRFWSPPSR
jgi:hypothetical protein